jgi:hypothetical protein
VFIICKTTSKLETHDLIDLVICRCRKHRQCRSVLLLDANTLLCSLFPSPFPWTCACQRSCFASSSTPSQLSFPPSRFVLGVVIYRMVRTNYPPPPQWSQSLSEIKQANNRVTLKAIIRSSILIIIRLIGLFVEQENVVL